jgi:hypothetical protein
VKSLALRLWFRKGHTAAAGILAAVRPVPGIPLERREGARTPDIPEGAGRTAHRRALTPARDSPAGAGGTAHTRAGRPARDSPPKADSAADRREANPEASPGRLARERAATRRSTRGNSTHSTGTGRTPQGNRNRGICTDTESYPGPPARPALDE